MKKYFMVSILLISLLLLFTACAGTQSAKNGAEESPSIDPKPSQETFTFTAYFGDDQAMYLVGEERSVMKNGTPLAELMLNELIQGPKSSKLIPTIPKEAKLLSVELADGVAYVNFSQEIKTKHSGGSAGETMTIYSIVNTLAQLPEIDTVQFLVNGEKEEAIWGHLYTLEPIEPDPALIASDKE